MARGIKVYLITYSYYYVLITLICNSPSEEFEVLCPSRVDQLLKEAYSLEQSMEEHKNLIRTKLSALSDVLKLAIK